MEFNEKLQKLRKEKDLTQERLANELFVSRTAVSKWESGRGYPGIDSLRAISKLFGVSIDDLLSGDELITIAESENREKADSMRRLAFGAFDCMMILLLFFPFFGQPESGAVRHVSLIVLDTAYYIKIAFISFAALTSVFGIIELALQNFSHPIWLRGALAISLCLSALGTILFLISPQPYAGAFVFCLFVMKGVLLLKRRRYE